MKYSVGSDRFASICACSTHNWKVDSILRKHPKKSSCLLVCFLESIFPFLVENIVSPITRCKVFCLQQKGGCRPLEPPCLFLFSLSFFLSFFLSLFLLFILLWWIGCSPLANVPGDGKDSAHFLFFCCVFVRTKTEILPCFHVFRKPREWYHPQVINI